MATFSFTIERDGEPVGKIRVEAHNLGLALATLAVSDGFDPDEFARMARRHRLDRAGLDSASASPPGSA